jgi:hypothetical protein
MLMLMLMLMLMQVHPRHMLLASTAAEPVVRLWSPEAAAAVTPQDTAELLAANRAAADAEGDEAAAGGHPGLPRLLGMLQQLGQQLMGGLIDMGMQERGAGEGGGEGQGEGEARRPGAVLAGFGPPGGMGLGTGGMIGLAGGLGGNAGGLRGVNLGMFGALGGGMGAVGAGGAGGGPFGGAAGGGIGLLGVGTQAGGRAGTGAAADRAAGAGVAAAAAGAGAGGGAAAAAAAAGDALWLRQGMRVQVGQGQQGRAQAVPVGRRQAPPGAAAAVFELGRQLGQQGVMNLEDLPHTLLPQVTLPPQPAGPAGSTRSRARQGGPPAQQQQQQQQPGLPGAAEGRGSGGGGFLSQVLQQVAQTLDTAYATGRRGRAAAPAPPPAAAAATVGDTAGSDAPAAAAAAAGDDSTTPVDTPRPAGGPLQPPGAPRLG